MKTIPLFELRDLLSTGGLSMCLISGVLRTPRSVDLHPPSRFPLETGRGGE